MSATLARLTASGVDFEGVGGGGIAEVTPCMISASLHGLMGSAYDLVLFKYCGDGTVVPRLKSDLARRVELQVPQVKQGEGMVWAEALLADNITGDLCNTCNGTGEYRYNPCKGCKGEGRKKKSERSMAEAVGLTRHHWKQWGKGWFQQFGFILETWEEKAAARVSRNLRH